MRTKDKHILVFNRSFWPDIEATGQFLTELCEQLAKRYKITVIAGRSYYEEKEELFRRGRFNRREIYKGIEILRVRHTKFWKGNLLGRITNWLTYSISAFLVALKIKPGAIIACTDPPFIGIIAMLLSRLNSIPFIYNCRDAYPDVALELGRLKPGFLSRIFDYLNKKAFLKASLVVCLGISMETRLRTKGVPEEHLRVIPDWADTSIIKPLPKKDNPFLRKFGLWDKFIVMYSGNIGLSQDFSSILHSLAMVEDSSSFYLIFIGEGSNKESLKEKVRSLGLKNVLFLTYQPQDMLSFSLGMADLHIVPLKKGLSGAIVPSKVYSIMAAGRPYLAITDKESEPARLIEEFGCGLWAAPGDTKAIAEELSWALTHREKLKEMGKIARRIAEIKFDKNVIMNEWLKIIDYSFSSLSGTIL